MLDKEELLHEFIWAHITKDSKSGFDILYTWNTELLGITIDSNMAMDWWVHNWKLVDKKEYTIKFLGDVVNVDIPVFKKSGGESIKQDYLNILNRYIKDWVLGDRRGTVISRLLENMDVVVFEWHIGFIEVKKFDENDIIFKSKTTSFNFGANEFKIDIEDNVDIGRYENVLLLMKEVQDWYYDVRTHSLVDKMDGKMVQQDYKIWRDVNIILNGNEVVDVKQEDTKYNAVKDKTGWRVITPTWEKVSAIGFKPRSIEEKDGLTYVHLIGAYTHLLRNMLDFNPLSRQYNMLMGQKRITFLAWCRRSGKTLLWSYLIVRELFRMPDSIKQTQRTVKSFYIAPSEDKFKEVVDYIKTASEHIRLLRVLDFNKKENRLYLYDEKLWRGQRVTMVVSSCDFVSAKGYEPGRWKASDFILVDEAAFVGEDVWLNILPILSNERAKFYAVSTIQWESMRNRFYEQLVDAEMWYDDEMLGMRVTIDDLENTLIAPEDKERMKRSLRHNKQRYYAELYATFPNSQNVFNPEGFFNIGTSLAMGEQIQWYVIGYDPAKRSDTWAVMVWEIRNPKNYNQYVELIEEYGLNWEYTEQREFIKWLKQGFIFKGYPCVLIMDVTGVWEAVWEIFGDIVDYKVLYTANGVRPVIDNYGTWKVPKTTLVHGTQLLMEKNMLKGVSTLSHLMDEMKYFVGYTTPAWNTKYEASAGHDDFVNAMMLVSYWYNYIEWHIYTLTNEKQISMEWINPITGLYEPFVMRSDIPASKRNLKAWRNYWFWV